jgi:PKD repeat protein
MNGRFIKEIILFLIIIQVTSLCASKNLFAAGEETSTLRIVDNSTGMNNTSLGNDTAPIPAGGLQFTVKILLNGTTSDLMTWQVGVTFDNNSLTCTKAWVPEADPSYVFYGRTEVFAVDLTHQNWDPPQVVLGASILDPSQSVTVENALLCMMNFTALKAGNYNISFLEPTKYTYTFLTTSAEVFIQYTAEDFAVNVAAARSNPVAVFSFSPQNPKANQTVAFDASASYDPNGEEIVAYLWDFGDNTTAANVTSKHAFSNNGQYQVNLTIVTHDNLTAFITMPVLVGTAPIALFTYIPLEVLPNEDVTFNASESTSTNATIVSYFWDFNDNSTFTDNSSITSHKYSANGVYWVNLTVTDNYGVYNSTILELQVGVPPVPLFLFDPPSPMVNDTVTFTASQSSGSPVTLYAWDFGDGFFENANVSTIAHIYYGEQDYIVTLTVFDLDGLHSSYNQTVPVIAPTGESAGADYTPQIVFGTIAAIVVVALVVNRFRRKKEEAIEI